MTNPNIFDIVHTANSAENTQPLPLPVVKYVENDFNPTVADLIRPDDISPPLGVEPKESEAPDANPESDIVIQDGKWSVTSERSHQMYPYHASGRITSTFNGRNYQCSGSLIKPNIVLTAGHCVQEGGTNNIHTNISFTPNFPNATEAFDVDRIYTMPGWGQSGSYAEDVALLRLVRRVPNFGFHGVVVDIPWGADPNADYNHYGWWGPSYPGQPPFSGDQQIIDGGPASIEPFRIPRGYFWNATLEAQGRNDLTPGSSGGPLLINPSRNLPQRKIAEGWRPTPGRIQYINGVNSFKYDRWPSIMVSPYFDGHTAQFIINSLLSAAYD